MGDLKDILLTWAVLFGISQLIAFLIDLIALAVRRMHPARIEKSEDISFPQYLTVYVWHDSHHSHGYKQIPYIRKGDNKYKRYIKHSIGGWIGIILLYLFFLVIIFALPAAVLICKPNNPRPELFGSSAIIFFLFLHWHLTGLNTIARIELNKYLKAQER